MLWSCLDDGTAFGSGPQRNLFESRDKCMGDNEIASYVFEHEVPRIVDYNLRFDVTPSTRRKLLIEALDVWIQCIHNYVMYAHKVWRYGHATSGKIKKLPRRPCEFRSALYKIATPARASRLDSSRSHQSGEWLWPWDGYTKAS